MTDEPLDLAAIRAAWVAPYPLREDGTFFSVIATLCDEIERLQLRETTLQFTLDTERGENERLRAENARHVAVSASNYERQMAVSRVVEAARAWANGDPGRGLGLNVKLCEAVAAYEAQQGEKPYGKIIGALAGDEFKDLDEQVVQPSPVSASADVEPANVSMTRVTRRGNVQPSHDPTCPEKVGRYGCRCGLAALEAKAAEIDSQRLYKKVLVAPDVYERLEADAAKWREFTGTRMRTSFDRTDSIVKELTIASADACRWRTVERAVGEYGGMTIGENLNRMTGDFCVVVAARRDRVSGPTLAAAVDALQERMDKEAE